MATAHSSFYPPVPVWSLRRHSVDRENSGTRPAGFPSLSFPPSPREVGENCSVWGSLAGDACGSRLLRRAALPSQRLLPVHTNGLASHPRQPLPLLSSLSSHTRLGLRSICSPHSRHAHVSEPFSLHRCMRVSTHRDTRTCPVLTHQTRPDRLPASLQHTPSSTV